MKKRSLWIGAVMVVMLAAASVVTLTGLGGNIAAAQNPPVIDPPGGDEPCVCPQNYDPVVCRASDNSLHNFPNLCVATCAGYTNCGSPDSPPEVGSN